MKDQEKISKLIKPQLEPLTQNITPKLEQMEMTWQKKILKT